MKAGTKEYYQTGIDQFEQQLARPDIHKYPDAQKHAVRRIDVLTECIARLERGDTVESVWLFSLGLEAHYGTL
jgi:hypothetical protein